jgi:hypothetical protein
MIAASVRVKRRDNNISELGHLKPVSGSTTSEKRIRQHKINDKNKNNRSVPRYGKELFDTCMLIIGDRFQEDGFAASFANVYFLKAL